MANTRFGPTMPATGRHHNALREVLLALVRRQRSWDRRLATVCGCRAPIGPSRAGRPGDCDVSVPLMWGPKCTRPNGRRSPAAESHRAQGEGRHDGLIAARHPHMHPAQDTPSASSHPSWHSDSGAGRATALRVNLPAEFCAGSACLPAWIAVGHWLSCKMAVVSASGRGAPNAPVQQSRRSFSGPHLVGPALCGPTAPTGRRGLRRQLRLSAQGEERVSPRRRHAAASSLRNSSYE